MSDDTPTIRGAILALRQLALHVNEDKPLDVITSDAAGVASALGGPELADYLQEVAAKVRRTGDPVERVPRARRHTSRPHRHRPHRTDQDKKETTE